MSQGHEVSSEVERKQDSAPTEWPETTVCDYASSHVQRSKGEMIHERSFGFIVQRPTLRSCYDD
jgi:hypothetical protein